MLEGIREFHPHSIWVFKSDKRNKSSKYIFPLITPSLVPEQYLFIEDVEDTRWAGRSRPIIQEHDSLSRTLASKEVSQYGYVLPPIRTTMTIQ
jgi:hypothetical protein